MSNINALLNIHNDAWRSHIACAFQQFIATSADASAEYEKLIDQLASPHFETVNATKRCRSEARDAAGEDDRVLRHVYAAAGAAESLANRAHDIALASVAVAIAMRHGFEIPDIAAGDPDGCPFRLTPYLPQRDTYVRGSSEPV